MIDSSCTTSPYLNHSPMAGIDEERFCAEKDASTSAKVIAKTHIKNVNKTL